MQEPQREPQTTDLPKPEHSEFIDSLRKGLLIGVALLVLIVPPLRMAKNREAERQMQQQAAAQAQQASAADGQGEAATPPSDAGVASASRRGAVRLADFRGEDPSADARLVANWAVFTGNHQNHAFVIVDKKDARVYVFGADGKLKDSAPALLGAAHGDDSFPGIGDKPLSAVRPEEKTTPAGRFVAEPGNNTNNEDIIWVDYDAAVSMHRIRPLVARERRLERLATLTTDDNRISFGCINLPVSFYENTLSPTVQKYGAIVYVLPEVKTARQVFGAYDVTDPAQVAAAREASARNSVQKVSLQTR
jgi:type II secretory pathway pseudopilin PulG